MLFRSMMAQSGMDYGAIFVGTCLAAAFACLFMGLYANWPVGLAPGMGLNAFFTYTVVGEMGYTWEVALGAVFIAGILFFIMSITSLRRWMLDSIPINLRIAMGAGVGLFIGFIGLKNGGGSLRIHNSELQKTVFEVIGLSKNEAEEQFGFLMDALSMGAPPHGGIAFGLEY